MYSNGPRLTTDKLVVCLDAAASKSYPRTGTEWYDISHHTWPTSLRGNIYFSGQYGGGIDYPSGTTTDFAFLPVGALQRLSNDLEWTIEFWVKVTRYNSDVSHISSMARTSMDNLFICRLQQTNGQFNVFQQAGIKPVVSGAYPIINPGTLFSFSIVNSSENCKLYKDGNLVTVVQPISGVSTATAWVLNQDQDAVSGGFSSTQSFIGTFYRFCLYDKSLSYQEVTNNYNAIRGRFGL